MSRTPSTAQHGFTLLEIIIALIVLGLLASFAAGKYIDMRAQTEAKICAANRAQLTANIRSYWLRKVTAGEDTEGLIQNGFDAIAVKPVCPTSGKGYRLVVSKDKDDVFVIVCDTHNSDDGTLGDTLKNYMTNDDYVASGGTVIGGGIVPTFESVGFGAMDSGAVAAHPGSWSAKVNTELQSQGIDLEKLGAPYWHYDQNQHCFIWTTVNINDLPVGSWIPVIRYNANTGTYTVWRTTLCSQTTTNNGITSEPYNAINNPGNGYAPSTGDKKENQTYENALKLYNELLNKEYPALTANPSEDAKKMQAVVNSKITSGLLTDASVVYDSGALNNPSSGVTTKLAPAMKNFGITDLKSFGFDEIQTWRISGTAVLSLTPADLNNGSYSKDDKINVIQFVPYSYGATGGTYRVVKASVAQSGSYLVIGVNQTPAVLETFDTYAQALAYYKAHPVP